MIHGLIRRGSTNTTERLCSILNDQEITLHYGDMTDSSNLIGLIAKIRPDEVYHLAAQSHVSVSFVTPEYTANADAIGTLRLLEAIKILEMHKTTRFYQASTSELFDWFKKPHSLKRHLFIPEVRTQSQNYMLIGSQ